MSLKQQACFISDSLKQQIKNKPLCGKFNWVMLPACQNTTNEPKATACLATNMLLNNCLKQRAIFDDSIIANIA